MNLLRALAFSWLLYLRSLSTSGFYILLAVVQPLILSSIASLLYRAGSFEEGLVFAAVGAGMMGIWSTTLFGSGELFGWLRAQGTLEPVVAAPMPLLFILLPMTIATATVGVYSVVSTLLWGALFFDVSLPLASAGYFFLNLVAAVISVGLLGLVMAASFVLYRQASAFVNMLEFPVWMITGLLVPASVLPPALQTVALFLAPYWGVRGLREALTGVKSYEALLACVGLSLLYLGVAAVALANLERLARRTGGLSLR